MIGFESIIPFMYRFTVVFLMLVHLYCLMMTNQIEQLLQVSNQHQVCILLLKILWLCSKEVKDFLSTFTLPFSNKGLYIYDIQ